MYIKTVVYSLSAISETFEMEPELEDVIMELASKAMFVGILPFPTDDLEGDIFIRWTRNETQNLKIRFPFTGGSRVGGCFGHIDKIGIENVELVALDNLGRWIVQIVVSLVILVPYETRVHSIEETRFAWTVLV